MKSADIRRHVLNLLKLSKQFLSEDGDLDPTAFIITASDQLLRPIELDDESHKLQSCKKIVEEARRQNALAIVTVFLARSKNFDKQSFVREDYSWGDIQSSSSERCILVTLSGPGIKNWATALPFKIDNGKVVFRKRVEFSKGLDLGLFPGWSEQIVGPTAS
jgi:hypothetical protein